MSQILHLAGPDDLERLLVMVEAYHAEEGIDVDAAHRTAALLPLLEGSPHGAVWLIGPRMSPVGYVAASFGWSIELGGMDGFVDELWIREKVRGRGMGAEALTALQRALADAGVKALHLEMAEGNRAERLYRRAGFRRRPFALMTWVA
ncbi:GNAT family N-acetyltransferase [Silicimonas algicola]|uniref:Acetyltransferase (GNAT) family protein n=1 Tax=Silicimonas algicola TaxID=1826607 RepID=A0A316GEU8_9RHOB|nr:GNAT family N-acetyltransferase [Silicimonas algicola]AZQ67713.1 GNAT family N-acetyltransferase [Silicimonas algicola]PWK57880.1 acetyltransferase (GNAT) family protein [Silicimonas algicola]